MNNEEKKEKFLNPEKLGISTPGPADPFSNNTKVMDAFINTSKSDESRSLFVRILIIIFSFLFFIFPPSFILFPLILNLDTISFKEANLLQISGGFLYLVIILLWFFVGLKIIYRNIRSSKKNKKVL